MICPISKSGSFCLQSIQLDGFFQIIHHGRVHMFHILLTPARAARKRVQHILVVSQVTSPFSAIMALISKAPSHICPSFCSSVAFRQPLYNSGAEVSADVPPIEELCKIIVALPHTRYRHASTGFPDYRFLYPAPKEDSLSGQIILPQLKLSGTIHGAGMARGAMFYYKFLTSQGPILIPLL